MWAGRNLCFISYEELYRTTSYFTTEIKGLLSYSLARPITSIVGSLSGKFREYNWGIWDPGGRGSVGHKIYKISRI